MDGLVVALNAVRENWQGRGLLSGYDPGGFYCELTARGEPTSDAALEVLRRLDTYALGELKDRAADIERQLYNLGITFTVYSDKDAIDRVLPFDALPRIITAGEWDKIERGCRQRVAAINAFLADVYGDQKIIQDGIIPRDLVEGNENFRRQMIGFPIAHNAYVSICGVDLVRGSDGEFYVLEDNARTPSGVSYVVENRHLTLRAFPDLIRNLGVRPVSLYGQQLVEKLGDLAPESNLDPEVVLLSPGVYNSAYFEHIFLAREMGVPLVEGRDLYVDADDNVFVRTISGPQRVDVIYRRIDDAFLDPEVFRPDSMLGVPGLMRAAASGKVVIANAVGTGVADDKAIYAYMPRIIHYYLGEEAILGNVETNICREREGLSYTLDNLDKLVCKPVGESGGYGVVIGPRASRDELDDLRSRIKAAPETYISQPMVELSVCPTLTEDGIEPRHVDLRPFVVTGQDSWVLPGGLSRVALKKGSLIVNSSQGGGSKDTWVLER